MFKIIEPEVSGGLGEDTKLDNSVHPPKVFNLHYQFDGWMGDDIVESFPCYIVTDDLKKSIENVKLTGIAFDFVKITKSDSFNELYPNQVLPVFHWMKILGKASYDDFGMSEDHLLVVSEKAFNILKNYNIDNLDYENVE